jgi:hypothetical protein
LYRGYIVIAGITKSGGLLEKPSSNHIKRAKNGSALFDELGKDNNALPLNAALDVTGIICNQ